MTRYYYILLIYTTKTITTHTTTITTRVRTISKSYLIRLGGIVVRMVESKCCELDFWLGHYQVVTIWMGDSLWTGEPSWYITNQRSTQPSIPLK